MSNAPRPKTALICGKKGIPGNFNHKEATMAVTVMIRRTFVEKEKAAKLAPMIVKLRSLATVQPGYITGQTFRCTDAPGEYLVLSTWHSVEDWNRWRTSETRMQIQKQIDDLLGKTTTYILYEPLVGGIIPKARGLGEE